MRVLVFGAGVLGTLYAARLKDAGHDVTILARGERAGQLNRHGAVLEDEATGRRTVTKLPVITELGRGDIYDVIFVIVRRDQLLSTLPPLAENRSPSVLFMVNNAGGPAPLVKALGQERVLLGFAGAGGTREGHVVRCRVVSGRTQPTTLGELSGAVTPRLREIRAMLRRAGFPVAFSPDMDAWLKTHAALVCPIANAFYYAGDNYRLAESEEGLRLLVDAVREGLRALGRLGIPIEPGKYRALLWVPAGLAVWVLRRAFATRRAELVLWRHARAARSEMQLLAEEMRGLIRESGVQAPAFDRLYPYAWSPTAQSC
ncbi:MAG TPA: 2-dehydropantoate 2-reductase N-terminal domain-containing protein [Symbiobacteriaceae bacterium]|nr:2-dehydropantoate 2-reductase N-terminal domain-containing protein [Symbiobacteriaceae bacterium]